MPEILQRNPYPYESGRGTLAVALHEGSIEFWGYVGRTPTRLLVIGRGVAELSADESATATLLEVKWSGYQVSLVPIAADGVVCRRIPTDRWLPLVEVFRA